MKLLLTSGGITNKKIAAALLELTGKPTNETAVAFIPTAANVDPIDKSWFINDLYNIKKQGYKMIDIVDISALPKKSWQPRLEASDILFFSGGNSTHLMRWVKESGLEDLLPELLKTRVYVGISAGSIITAKDLALSNPDKKKVYKENFGYEIQKGLGFVDFYIRPHLYSPLFPNTSKEALESMAKKISSPLYALDDQMALKVVSGKVEIIGEGDYLVFNT